MTTLVNTFLQTGVRIRELELQLAAGDRSAELGAEHQRLIHLQQDQIVAAVNAGVSWETVRFSLMLHGQHSSREYGDPRPTPAELLLEMFAKYGPDRVMQALDDFQAALTEAVEEYGAEAVWRHLEQRSAGTDIRPTAPDRGLDPELARRSPAV